MWQVHLNIYKYKIRKIIAINEENEIKKKLYYALRVMYKKLISEELNTY